MKTIYELFVPNGEMGFSLRRGHPAIEVGYVQLRRYAANGVTHNGRTVRLRVFLNPTTLHTTLSEWDRFIAACNE